jgi:hypothetical protein
VSYCTEASKQEKNPRQVAINLSHFMMSNTFLAVFFILTRAADAQIFLVHRSCSYEELRTWINCLYI